MTLGELMSLIGMAMVASWTPGPNNALLATSGSRFGFQRTWPHILGIVFGFPLMIFCIAVGLGILFQQSIFLREALRLIGIGVLLWLAWNIARSGELNIGKTKDRPFKFAEAAAFQWINPKAWVMAVSITSQFVNPEMMILTSLIISGVFVVAAISSATAWAWLGMSLQKYLTSESRRKAFNLTMAALLVFSIIVIATSELA